MKRITTAALAAITALSLSTTAAFAEANEDDSSSEITSSSNTENDSDEDSSSLPGSSEEEDNGEGGNTYATEVSPGHEFSSETVEGSADSSSEENQDSLADLQESIFGSSYENDAEQDWALGSSADALIGILLAIGAAFAAVSGLIPGLSI